MHKDYYCENLRYHKHFLQTLITTIIIFINFTDSIHSVPVATGVINDFEHGTTTYTNKIFLKEDSSYQGRLGIETSDTNESNTFKFDIEYPPRHGELELNETTGEFSYIPYSANFRGPDSFGYFVTIKIINSKQKSKYKQIFVSVLPINGYEALKKTMKQPLWGMQHYLNRVTSYPHANIPNTQAFCNTEIYIPYETKKTCNNQPVAIGVVIEPGNSVIAYTNQISLKEDSIYKGHLGVLDNTNNGTIKFALEYKPIHGIVEINEKTGKFSYVPKDPNFKGPDSFGYFVSYFVNKNDTKYTLRQKSKYKQIFVTVNPIIGSMAFKKTLAQPLWGFQHYLNAIK